MQECAEDLIGFALTIHIRSKSVYSEYTVLVAIRQVLYVTCQFQMESSKIWEASAKQNRLLSSGKCK